MKNYVGLKFISAEPMTYGEYSKYNSKKGYNAIPISMNPDKKLMTDREGYLVKYEDGYESWSPKDVFEKAYRETEGVTFGIALEAAKRGKSIARKTWLNLVETCGSPINPMTISVIYREGEIKGDNIICHPYLQMHNIDGSYTMWIPGFIDLMADDWVILDY